MKLAIVTVAVLLAGCASAGVAGPRAQSPGKAWLAGHWTPPDVDCESDGGVAFKTDGTWIAYEAAGTWRLKGPKLIAITTDRWESGGEYRASLSSPEKRTEWIEVLGYDSYRSRRADGEVVEMKRCPMSIGR